MNLEEMYSYPGSSDHDQTGMRRIAELEATIAEAEARGARIVLDAIADTGFFGVAGEYGTAEKRDAVIQAALAEKGGTL